MLIWLIIFIIAVIVFGIVSSEIDSWILATFTLLFGLIGLEYLFNMPVWETIRDNPFLIVIYVVLYIFIGIFYSYVWKFPEYIKEHTTAIQREYDNFKKHAGEKGSFANYLNSDYYEFSAKDKISEITTWTLSWPFSLLWELSRKPAKWVFSEVWKVVSKKFEIRARNIANKLNIKDKI